MKWYKFGFTRTYDNLSLEIRNGRMTRDEAVETLRQRGDETPWEDLQVLSSFAGVSVEWLLSIAETFRSEEVWDRRPDGIWEIPGFLISEWQWL